MSGGADSTRFPHLCILASAGSGKTFQLTHRFLALVAAGAPAGSILASTFTRAAAGEIRGRILMRLAEAAEDENARRELEKLIRADGLGRDDVLAMLRMLTANMHRLQIRTLDSFFASVVRSFAIELGIPVNGQITDEAGAEGLRHEAIRLMLDERDPQRLIDLLRRLTQGRSDRSVMQTIDEVVAYLYSLYRQSPAEAWKPLPAMPALSTTDLVEAIQLLQEIPPFGDGRFTSAHQTDCTNALARDWSSFLGSGLAKAICAGKTDYYRKPIEPEVMAGYEPLIRHARAVINNRLRNQTIATRDLLAMFDAQYVAARHRRGVMTFADITAAMTDARNLGRFEEICFRIDAQIQHLLLDEFQDTSIPQWRALEPIAEEVVSDISRPRSFFCVGDAKQSIYAWREAAPEILDEIPDLLTGPDGRSAIHLQTLAESWRSSQPVIEAVNTVFESLPANPAAEEYSNAVAAFARTFEHHQTNRNELSGYFELRTMRRTEEDESKDVLRLRAAAELTRSLHEKAPDKTIALLTRTNKAVARLLFEFSPGQLNLSASGRGGSPLTDTPAVEAILDLLTLADHPDDTIAAFNVARGPLGEVLEFADEQDGRRRRRISRFVRRRLLEEGYAQAIAGWVAAMAPACDERQYRRLLQLIELAGRHDEDPTLRTEDFITQVEQHVAAAHRPAPVQVMTVHQAKGLEFDIVILPDLEGPLTGSGNPTVVFERDGPTGPVRRICRYVNKTIRELLPEIQPVFDHYETRTVRESFSVLYVAMTRARHALYMLIDPPTIRKSGQVSSTIPKTAAGVVRCAMHGADPPEPDTVLFTCGEESWTRRVEPASKEEPQALPAIPDKMPLAEPKGLIARGIAAQAASALHEEAAQPRPDHRLFTLPDQAALDRGIAIHKLFEQIEWLEDFTPDESELRRLIQRTLPRRGEAWAKRQVEDFREMLGHPDIRDALSRDTEPTTARQVFRELPFARLLDGRVQTGFIDRLIIERDAGGAPAAAVIIDFKTDAVEPKDARQHAEAYRVQLETYRAATETAFGLPAPSIRMVLLFVQAGIAIELA
ncbi:MAG: UvrD-helicase domain-containing protein [Phycisphaerales bacterium]|nr:MAG: UvrD-helicase domain-containing protein [Phycisphaerales bacterium]